jgi:hypothetical protein
MLLRNSLRYLFESVWDALCILFIGITALCIGCVCLSVSLLYICANVSMWVLRRVWRHRVYTLVGLSVGAWAWLATTIVCT